jgi:hypothetical protein
LLKELNVPLADPAITNFSSGLSAEFAEVNEAATNAAAPSSVVRVDLNI